MKDPMNCHYAENGLEREKLEAGRSVIQVRVEGDLDQAEGNGQIQERLRKNGLD